MSASIIHSHIGQIDIATARLAQARAALYWMYEAGTFDHLPNQRARDSMWAVETLIEQAEAAMTTPHHAEAAEAVN